MNIEDRGESSDKQHNSPQSTQTSEAQNPRADAERAAEFAAGQTRDQALEKNDPELADFLAALDEHAARARVAEILVEDVNP